MKKIFLFLALFSLITCVEDGNFKSTAISKIIIRHIDFETFLRSPMQLDYFRDTINYSSSMFTVTNKKELAVIGAFLNDIQLDMDTTKYNDIRLLAIFYNKNTTITEIAFTDSTSIIKNHKNYKCNIELLRYLSKYNKRSRFTNNFTK